MSDSKAREGLTAADLQALGDLQAKKRMIGEQIGDESLPAHVRGRLLTEWRQFVLAIHALELRRPEPAERTSLDEIRERREARRRAVNE